MERENNKVDLASAFGNGMGELTRLQKRLQEVQCCARNYAVILFAGDNGVSWERTSRYEPMNSSSIVLSHFQAQSPTSFFLKRISRSEFIVDTGLYKNVDHSALLQYKVRNGSRNFLYGDALTLEEVEQALDIGRIVWERIADSRFDIIGVGEIGIGDTLCAAAIGSVLTAKHPAYMTGRGSSDDKVISQKVDIIVRAMTQRHPEINIMDLLTRFGGLEIAGLTGFILEAVAHGVPVMLDGYVTAVAALLASLRDNRVSHYIIAPSLCLEKGHPIILDQLGIEPVFQLDFNYGEGLVSAMGLFMAEMASNFSNMGL